MLIDTNTGRVLGRGDSLRLLTNDGFTEGVLDTLTLAGAIRVRSGAQVHDVAFDDVHAIWRLAG